MLLDLRVGSYISSGIDLIAAVKQVATLHGWTEIPKYSSESARSKWESLSALISVAVDLKSHNPNASFDEYFAEIAHRTNENYDPQAAAVTISTIHTAKGLEWDHVFIPSVVEGILPFDPKRAPENTEEERRLFYVAITRAKQVVQISTSRTRLGYENAPSRFLNSVGSTAEAFLVPISQAKVSKPAPRPELKVEKCRVCDSGINQVRELALKICNKCEKKQPKAKFSDNIKTGLISWREDYATQVDMLPWLLLSDLAIDALAEFQPKTVAELDGIHGINSAKADVIGEEILLVIAANQHD
jgi:DNA helicase-2/ATP-dependent DNA helicase PcrA